MISARFIRSPDSDFKPLTVALKFSRFLPQPDILPPRMAELVERAREHPAGRYALALFTKHRQREVVNHGNMSANQ